MNWEVMSSLTTNEKQVLEKLFQMGSGYVLNFSDRTFAEFFRDELHINIMDAKYNYASGSKANRLRGFWSFMDDTLVGRLIEKLIAYTDTQVLIGRLNKQDFPDDLLSRVKTIAGRLQGKVQPATSTSEDEFIAKEFGKLPIDKLGLDPGVIVILRQRLDEIQICLVAKAPLAVIFHCGSALEGILLGIACMKPKDFNQSALSPKDTSSGKVKPFPQWKLAELINVARDLNLLGEDVKKFSHAMRDFRNYIHPYEQMASGFSPDEHTAKICWQVLQAAITQLSH